MAIAFVTGQTKSGTDDAFGTTLAAAAFTSNNTAGNCLCVAVSWGLTDVSGNAGFTVTDNASGGSNTYTRALSTWDGTNAQGLAIFYALNLKGTEKLTCTANFASTNVSYRRIIVCEYSGVATSSAADGTSGIHVANGSTSANAIVSTSGSDPTTSVSGDLLFGAVMDDAGTTSITAGTNFTERNSVNSEDLEIEDRVLAGTGTVVATWTFGAAHRYLAGCIALKPAAGGGPYTGGNMLLCFRSRDHGYQLRRLTLPTRPSDCPWPLSDRVIRAAKRIQEYSLRDLAAINQRRK